MSPFASPTIRIHLARGMLAAFCIFAAVASYRTGTVAGDVGALALGAGALFFLRGCPMCWTIGLFETVAKRFARRAEMHRPM